MSTIVSTNMSQICPPFFVDILRDILVDIQMDINR